MITALQQRILASWPEVGEGPAPIALSVCQISGTGWHNGRVHFAIAADGHVPELFARIVRRPADEPLLEREYGLLERLAATVEMAEQVPKPLFLDRLCSQLVLCERAVAGSSMEERLRRVPGSARFRFAAELAVARDLAIRLGLATRRSRTAVEVDESVLEPLRSFYLRAGGVAREIDTVLGDLRAAVAASPITVTTHGDFIAKNLRGEAGRAALIDWETVEEEGLPLIDLLYFLTRCAYTGLTVLRRDKVERVKTYYASRGSRARLGRSAIERYCRELGLDPAAIGPLFRLHFLWKARIKARTTSLDNKITAKWLELFERYACDSDAPWSR